MAANIVSPAQSGRFYYGCAGAAGLLAGPAIVFWFSSPGQLVAVRSGACLPRHAVCYAIRGGECRGYSAGGLRHPNAVGLRAGLLSSRSQ